MRGYPTGLRSSLLLVRLLLFGGLAIFVLLPLAAQQTDINRYTVYTGFDTMISPARSLILTRAIVASSTLSFFTCSIIA